MKSEGSLCRPHDGYGHGQTFCSRPQVFKMCNGPMQTTSPINNSKFQPKYVNCKVRIQQIIHCPNNPVVSGHNYTPRKVDASVSLKRETMLFTTVAIGWHNVPQKQTSKHILNPEDHLALLQKLIKSDPNYNQ